jgi:hypothetical protein
MAAGLGVDRAQLDRELGTALANLRNVLMRLGHIKSWTDQYTAGQLEANLGYTTAESADLKSAVADAGQLIAIFEGSQNLTTAKDFRTFIQRLWGLGGQG